MRIPVRSSRSAALLAASLALLGACARQDRGAGGPAGLRTALRARLEQAQAGEAAAGRKNGPPAGPDAQVLDLYSGRGMSPCWVTPAGPNAKAEVLRTALSRAETQGL